MTMKLEVHPWIVAQARDHHSVGLHRPRAMQLMQIQMTRTQERLWKLAPAQGQLEMYVIPVSRILVQLITLVLLQVRAFFGQKHPITIADLFDWSVEAGWSMFWDVGKRHYNEEMLFYELVSRLDSEGHTDAQNLTPQETSSAANEPIEIDDTD